MEDTKNKDTHSDFFGLETNSIEEDPGEASDSVSVVFSEFRPNEETPGHSEIEGVEPLPEIKRIRADKITKFRSKLKSQQELLKTDLDSANDPDSQTINAKNDSGKEPPSSTKVIKKRNRKVPDWFAKQKTMRVIGDVPILQRFPILSGKH